MSIGKLTDVSEKRSDPIFRVVPRKVSFMKEMTVS